MIGDRVAVGLVADQDAAEVIAGLGVKRFEERTQFGPQPGDPRSTLKGLTQDNEPLHGPFDVLQTTRPSLSGACRSTISVGSS